MTVESELFMTGGPEQLIQESIRELSPELTTQLLTMSVAIHSAEDMSALLAAVVQPFEAHAVDRATLVTFQYADGADVPEQVTMIAEWNSDPDAPDSTGQVFNMADFPLTQAWIASHDVNFYEQAQSDERLDDGIHEINRHFGVQSSISMPLIHDGSQIGIINLSWHQPCKFTPEVRKLCSLLPALVTPAIIKHLNEQLLEQRVQSQTAGLRASEQRYRNLIENLRAGVVVHAADGSILMSNPMAHEILGLTEDQMQGKTPIDPAWSFVREDNSTMPVEEYPISRVLATQQPLENYIVGVNHPGARTRTWVLVNAFPRLDNQGNLHDVTITFTDISAQRKAEFGMRQMMEVVENAGDYIGIANPQGFLTYLNPTGRKMSGIAPDADVTQYNVGQFIPQDEAHMVQEALETGGWKGEVDLIALDGTMTPASHSINVHYNDDGSVAFMSNIVRDMRSVRQIQENLRASEERLQMAVRSAPLVLAVMDAEGTFILSEGGGLGMLGLEPGQVVGMSVFEVYKDFPDIQASIKKVLAGQSDHYFTTVGDVTFESWYEPMFDARGDVTGCVGLSIDVTDRKKAQVAIQQQQEFLQLIINTIPYPIYVRDYNGVYSLANDMAALNFGVKADDLIGKTDLDLGADEATYEYMLGLTREAIDSDEQSTIPEVPMTMPTTGETRYFQSISVPITSIDGESKELLGLAIDITERKQAEEERERLQQEVIDAQRQALADLSTPIIPLLEGIIVMPLIGTIDTARARQIMRSLLQGINENRASVVILDITGVPMVDSGVADHLNRTIQAARLKGANTIITGVSDAVAETIVELGIDWTDLETLTDLQSGLNKALARMGLRLCR